VLIMLMVISNLSLSNIEIIYISIGRGGTIPLLYPKFMGHIF